MPKLIVNKSFEPVLKSLISQLPQSLLLSGDIGAGLSTVAKHVAGEKYLVIEPQTSKGEVDLTGGTIQIERIRRLYQQTRSKHSSTQIFIIKNADRMNHNAQNAFLKLLEEPGESIRFILTTHHKQRLLPTILSRVRQQFIPPISPLQSKSILMGYKLNETEIKQAMFIASGKPVLLHSLAGNSGRLKAAATLMNDARNYLSAKTSYDRLVVALGYAGSRAEAISLLEASLSILKHLIYNQPSAQIASQSELIIDALSKLDKNVNPKLTLLATVLK